MLPYHLTKSCVSRQRVTKIKEIEKQLDERFYRCHRSCIINKDFIDKVDYELFDVHMKNGMKCPFSFRAKGGLRKLMRPAQ